MSSLDPVIEKLISNGNTNPCPVCRGVRVWYQGLGAGEWHCETCYTGRSGSGSALREESGGWKPIPAEHFSVLNLALKLRGVMFTLGRFDYTTLSFGRDTIMAKKKGTDTGVLFKTLQNPPVWYYKVIE